jgi:hypothetical protein
MTLSIPVMEIPAAGPFRGRLLAGSGISSPASFEGSPGRKRLTICLGEIFP